MIDHRLLAGLTGLRQVQVRAGLPMALFSYGGTTGQASR
jgi:hypothetical protein